MYMSGEYLHLGNLSHTVDHALINAMKKKRTGTNFWDEEYKTGSHLALSDEPSEDFLKFLRHLEREEGRAHLNPTMSVLDLGCGNGRNLIYVSKTYHMRGWGCDISASAIGQAKRMATGMPLTFEVRSLSGAYTQPDASQALIIDAMASHVLSHHEREVLHDEVYRMLRPGGWYFFKTFLLDEDKHAARLLKENPGPEAHSYIHPVIGVPEYVFGEDDLITLLEKRFTVQKVLKSHGHLRKGDDAKRRSISLYCQK